MVTWSNATHLSVTLNICHSQSDIVVITLTSVSSREQNQNRKVTIISDIIDTHIKITVTGYKVISNRWLGQTWVHLKALRNVFSHLDEPVPATRYDDRILGVWRETDTWRPVSVTILLSTHGTLCFTVRHNCYNLPQTRLLTTITALYFSTFQTVSNLNNINHFLVNAVTSELQDGRSYSIISVMSSSVIQQHCMGFKKSLYLNYH